MIPVNNRKRFSPNQIAESSLRNDKILHSFAKKSIVRPVKGERRYNILHSSNLEI